MVALKAFIKASMDNWTQHILVSFLNGQKLKISVKRVLSLNRERFCILLEECLYPGDSVVFRSKSGHLLCATAMSSEEPDKQVTSAVRSWKRKKYPDFLLDSPIFSSQLKKKMALSETSGKKKSVNKDIPYSW